jgi:hypothetical protein
MSEAEGPRGASPSVDTESLRLLVRPGSSYDRHAERAGARIIFVDSSDADEPQRAAEESTRLA